MSLASMFGLDKVGEQSVEQAHATINDALTKLDPLLHNVFNRLGGICHGLLDRFEVNITIKLNPVGKAQPVEPDQQV